ITPRSGPNGAIGWLTCGINSTGWTPSFATVEDIITADLSSALAQGNSQFDACDQYLDIIEKYAAQFRVPSILVASFAMQESGCQADSQGEGGEQGIMQISQDKCDGAPDGDCKNPDFNIHRGTQFLANTLSENKGNILLTIGQYNGWYAGMTFEEATAAAHTSCCHCQPNLDYLFQMLNGWLLNRNPLVPPRLGAYFNLDVCNDE
ncbi:glycoside hydrolase family 23 protein, partial [Hysterangium stoloniferum]